MELKIYKGGDTLCFCLLAGAKRAALYAGWSQGRDGREQNTKLSINHSFLELQSKDFALKFEQI